MTGASFYDMKEPTRWAEAPQTFSFSSLQAVRACPRRWQLVHSEWGSHSRFPERPQPAAIEGQIIHEALDLLARELGLQGRPAIGSDGFRAALDKCGFWAFFDSQVEVWNRRLASHPRAGPRYVLRTKPRDLANQAVCLFRERYRSGAGEVTEATVPEVGSAAAAAGAALVSLLQGRGALSEVRLDHPSLPLLGVLDLVVLEQDQSTTIVDFKTGAQKPAHEEQLVLYSMLWWRVTGERPKKAVVQYLDSTRVLAPTEKHLVAAEESAAKEVEQAKATLAARPAAARPGNDCSWCPVRPRCAEGWAFTESAPRAAGDAKRIDMEVTVASSPSATGFLGKRANGDEVSLVFDAAVGCGLPPAKAGDRFRIVDAATRAGGKEVAVLPWTEMYRL